MWRVFIIHVSIRAFGDALEKTWMFGNTPLFLSAQVERWTTEQCSKKEEYGDMQFQCPKCKAILASDDVAEGMSVMCPECGSAIECRPHVGKVKLRKIEDCDDEAELALSLPGSIHDKVASAIGIEKLKGFKLSELFADVFSKHSREEVENYFTTGTEKSTPDILAVYIAWPKPWLFMRMTIASLILFSLLWAGWKQFANANLIPGLMMIGSFAIPISTLVLFTELNICRNVSLYMVTRLAFLGGVLSLLITSVIDSLAGCGLLPNSNVLSWMGASSAGPMEETAKVLAMLAVARAAKYKYKLNGLLVGAAVGVGFASFESMGYALSFFTNGTIGGTIDAIVAERTKDLDMARNVGVLQGANAMIEVIMVRGILSPLGHIVWSAIAGCALWRVIRDRVFEWKMLCDEKFIRLLLVPVFLHMVWNAPFELPFYGKYLVVGAVGWFVCLSLVQEGLHEIAIEQSRLRAEQDCSAKDDEDGGL